MAEHVELTVSGEKVIGALHRGKPETDTCIIMCHGLLSNKDSVKYIVLGEACEKYGFNAIRFDFRGCGESEGRIKDTTVSKRMEDLNAVIEYVTQELGVDSIGLFGSSLGGYISLIKASQGSNIKALVCIATPHSMMELIDPENFAKGYLDIDGIRIEGTFFDDLESNDAQLQKGLAKINIPVLLFQGDKDTLVPVEHAFKIYEEINTQKDLKILTGAEHLIISPKHLGFILKTSFNWFNKYLWEEELTDD